jgi:hypothetical protein
MRLLGAKKFELVDVRDDEIPPYTILPHTWGDEEITLQELRHMKGRMQSSLDKRKRTVADKKGFVKIKDAAALAVKGDSHISGSIRAVSTSQVAQSYPKQSIQCISGISNLKTATPICQM